jgi:hypothetical protein
MAQIIGIPIPPAQSPLAIRCPVLTARNSFLCGHRSGPRNVHVIQESLAPFGPRAMPLLARAQRSEHRAMARPQASNSSRCIQASLSVLAVPTTAFAIRMREFALRAPCMRNHAQHMSAMDGTRLPHSYPPFRTLLAAAPIPIPHSGHSHGSQRPPKPFQSPIQGIFAAASTPIPHSTQLCGPWHPQSLFPFLIQDIFAAAPLSNSSFRA